jgi:hypothetical protein
VTTAYPAPVADTRRRETRVRLKPGTPGHGHVDGAWWPYSYEAAIEFPALIAELRASMGTVSRVSYRIGEWDATKRKLSADGRLVRLEGFRTMPVGTLTLIDSRTRRRTLLVIPPASPQGMARAILATASNPEDSSSVEELLATLPPDEVRGSTAANRAGGEDAASESPR